jgi:hypothetical protein
LVFIASAYKNTPPGHPDYFLHGPGTANFAGTQFDLIARGGQVVLPWYMTGTFQLANSASGVLVTGKMKVSDPSGNYGFIPGKYAEIHYDAAQQTTIGATPLVLDNVPAGMVLRVDLKMEAHSYVNLPEGYYSGTTYGDFRHTLAFDWQNAKGVIAPPPTPNTLIGPAEIPDAPAAVPEPSALLVWSSLAMVGLIAGWRKRKRAGGTT